MQSEIYLNVPSELKSTVGQFCNLIINDKAKNIKTHLVAKFMLFTRTVSQQNDRKLCQKVRGFSYQCQQAMNQEANREYLKIDWERIITIAMFDKNINGFVKLSDNQLW